MKRTLLILTLLAVPVTSQAQQPLSEVARAAREAVLRGDLAPLVSSSRGGLRLRLPGVEPSSPLGPAQANATLRGMFRRNETAEVTIENSNLRGSRLYGFANQILDDNGAALVIHAQPDDMQTDPSGSSGDRIACAELAAASMPPN